MNDQQHPLLTSLNPAQQAAVSANAQHTLILAGAGSGKTRVLVHRIAWLISEWGVSPYAILSVTFTNKAASEMRARIESLCHFSGAGGLWMGTFHGLSNRLLHAHWQAAGLCENFQVIDSEDQLRLIKRIHRELDIDDNYLQPKDTRQFINRAKEAGRRPVDVAPQDDYLSETMLRVYMIYEELCQRSGLVDFTELLLRSVELLEQHADIREHYQQRFKHILVDEFQDTNVLQYRWLRLLKGEASALMVVGDDDQSIYSWRGAEIENMHRFSRDFSDTTMVRLEQNYRSTQIILSAANAVIARNGKTRLGKSLWTENPSGDPIVLFSAFNERDEAFFVVSTIRQHLRDGHDHYSDFAVLYRSNAQSRILEEAFMEAQIPYRIHGGLKFFERAEIKDALAYLRLVMNRDDDAAFERAVNTPTRGIGQTTLNKLRECGREQSLSLWQSAQHLITHKALSSRACSALEGFLQLLDQLTHDTTNLTLGEQTEIILKRSSLFALYQKDRSAKGLSRVENLEELINATSQFTPPEQSEESLSPLAIFLTHVALDAGENQADASSDCVHLMTLHAAKGLEFPTVFLVGLEESLFPHSMSMDSSGGLEEERRLCYVGMTRAKKQLYLSYAESRFLHGSARQHSPSRFVHEIPKEFLRDARPKTTVTPARSFDRQPSKASKPWNQRSLNSIDKPRQRKSTTSDDGVLCVGQTVQHHKYGTGVIVNRDGQGDNATVHVVFDDVGEKRLNLQYAKLETV